LKVFSGDTSSVELFLKEVAHAHVTTEFTETTFEAAVDLEFKVLEFGFKLLTVGAEETTDESTEGLSDTRSSSLGD